MQCGFKARDGHLCWGRQAGGEGAQAGILRSEWEAVVGGRPDEVGRGCAASSPLLLQVTVNLVAQDHRQELWHSRSPEGCDHAHRPRVWYGWAWPCGLQGSGLSYLFPGRGCLLSPQSHPAVSPVLSAPAPFHKDPMTALGPPGWAQNNLPIQDP